MSGWTKALFIIGLVVVGTIALNIAMWQRMKRALAERKDWTEADFISALSASGCDPQVPAVTLNLVRPYYHAGVAPQSGDSLKRFLAVDEEEIEGWVADAFAALGMPEPSRTLPERIPVLDTVGDFVAYLDRRRRELRPGAR